MIFKLLLLGVMMALDPPAPEALPAMVRGDHPRLFLTAEQWPAFRQRARTEAAAEFSELQKRVDAYPATPQLEWRTDRFELPDGKLVFRRKFSDQNSASMAVVSDGGVPALECAIAFRVTGERRYRDRAIAFLKLHAGFVEWAAAQKIMVDWRHFSRLAAFTAYDWLHDQMTPEERREIAAPMLRNVEKLRKPGYITNFGDAESGNYGEAGLRFFAGLATVGDGIDDPVAAGLLRDGYRHFVRMMDFREEISGGTGILLNYCVKYGLGDYPWASFNFLRCLRSGTGFDGTRRWTQMRGFANYFAWAVIPSSCWNTVELGHIPDSGFLDYGWGDTDHARGLLEAPAMYPHLSQIIDLYGENPAARRAIGMIPPANRTFNDPRFPQLPFLLTRFRVEAPASASMPEPVAATFPSCGISYMRSGLGENDTYASFRGGARFAKHHNHYDELSFIIYKKGFQALDSGDRGETPHHLVYYPQSVAHNTLLIRMPEEVLPPHWYTGPEFDRTAVFNDGGQCRKGAGKILFSEITGRYAVFAADATACYAPQKCREAVRFFVYLAPDCFVIYDRVESVKPEQEKVFLLHTRNRPQELAPGLWRSEVNGGALFLRQLLPEGGRNTIIGGPDREFATNGKNWPCRNYEEVFKRPNWLGAYRLEWSATPAANAARFLAVLEAADRNKPQMIDCRRLYTETEDGVELTTPDHQRWRILFKRTGTPGYTINQQSGEPQK